MRKYKYSVENDRTSMTPEIVVKRKCEENYEGLYFHMVSLNFVVKS